MGSQTTRLEAPQLHVFLPYECLGLLILMGTISDLFPQGMDYNEWRLTLMATLEVIVKFVFPGQGRPWKRFPSTQLLPGALLSLAVLLLCP